VTAFSLVDRIYSYSVMRYVCNMHTEDDDGIRFARNYRQWIGKAIKQC